MLRYSIFITIMAEHDTIRYLKVSVTKPMIFNCANILLQNSENLLNQFIS